MTSYNPRIISNGGGHEAHISINENTRFVTDVETYDTVSSEANGRLRYSIIGGADRHLFEINHRNGQLQFKNAPDFENPQDHGRNNVYDVRIQVKDGGGYTDTQRLYIKVQNTAENRRPELIPGEGSEFHVDEGNTFVADINASDDSSSEGDGLSYAIAGGIDSDAFEINSQTGELTFKQTPDFEAPTDADGDNEYHVKVQVTDENGAQDTDSYRVVVKDQAENAAPEAQDDDAFTNEGESVTIDVLNNDSDPDGDAISISSLENASNGTVELNDDGTVTYTPDEGFVGEDSFNYHITDGSGEVSDATVFVQVADVNEAPIAQDDEIFINQDEAIDIDVLSNDSDPDGDDLSISSLEQAANGTVLVNEDGTISYRPNNGFAGQDSFTYHITDGNGEVSDATVVVNVANVNEAPIAQDDFAVTDENQPIDIDVLGNDSDPDGDSISVSSLEDAANGTVSLNDDGTISYTPNDGFIGTDIFNYHITDGNGEVSDAPVRVEVSDVNGRPDAIDDTATVAPGEMVTIDVLNNDADPDGDNLFIIEIMGTGPVNGTAEIVGDQIKYTANPGFEGNDTFAYQITDGNGGTDVAQVVVNVEPDEPVDPKTGFIGNRVFLDENSNGRLDNNEGGAADVRVTLTSAGQDGVLGTFDDVTVGSQVTGDGGYYGFGNLMADQYKVTFGDLPTGLAFTTPNVGGDEARDSDADPNTGMTEEINLAPGQSLTTVDAGVVEQNFNEAPIAEDDNASTLEGESVTINVLSNDSDPDGDAISVSSLEQAANGSVALNDDGSVTYTPDAGFVGNDVFNYHITDGNGTVSDAQVFVNVEEGEPVDPKTGFIGNRVFLDENQNGIQDAGESGVDGVHVTLVGAGQDGIFSTADDLILSQDTSNGGFYGFSNLASDQYKVGFSKLPQGLEFTAANVGINENVDSDADPTTGITGIINLAPAQFVSSVDAGLVEEAGPVDPQTGFIGNRVFFDENANGVHDNGEEGFGGVRVTLTGAGQDGVIGTDDDVTVGSQVVGDNGYYGFSNLAGGDYKVTFSDIASGFELTAANVGGNEALDSDPDPVTGMTGVISLAPAEFNSKVDAGVIQSQPMLPTIAEIVAASGGEFDSNSSDFDILLNAVQTAGLVDALNDPDADLTTFAPTDAAFVKLAQDLGFAGSDEAGAFNAIVNTLTDLGGGDPLPLLTDILLYHVSPEGKQLSEIQSLDQVTTLLDGVTITPDGDSLIDQEPDLVDPTFESGLTNIEAKNGVVQGIDRVLIPLDIPGDEPVDPKTGFIGNRVFFDENANGIHDNGEAGFGGVRVSLSTGAGPDRITGTDDDIIASQVVGNDGYYGFSNLAAGDYQLFFSKVPAGFSLTEANVGENDAIDSDATGGLLPSIASRSGSTGVISLAPGEFNSTVDAGIIRQPEGSKLLFLGSDQADWPLEGSNADDSIFGLGGNDEIKAFDGDDHLTGGSGNDRLLGGNGADTLNGTDDVALGQFEVDNLVGGAGPDRFILANSDTSYYFGDEWSGFAIINDFTVGEDVAVLHGPADQYILEVDPVQGVTSLYCLSDGADKNRDAIAIFQGNTNLDLASSSFQFIG